jgi:hypothetical protein
MLHAWHAEVHALLQQTPSTQKPLAHWPPEEHELPLAARHVLLVMLHAKPARHWALVEQLV